MPEAHLSCKSSPDAADMYAKELGQETTGAELVYTGLLVNTANPRSE